MNPIDFTFAVRLSPILDLATLLRAFRAGFLLTCISVAILNLSGISRGQSDSEEPAPAQSNSTFKDRSYKLERIQGWEVRIDERLIEQQRSNVEIALRLLTIQLKEIEVVVPAKAVEKLRAVPLYFTLPYEGTVAKAEYHPSAAWLRANGRDTSMAKGIEFTNIAIYKAETDRMPNFPLHELAHAYHDRVLEDGFQNQIVTKNFERVKKAGKYELVERHFGNGRAPSREKAYALTNPMEYFAEATESYFVRNDFYPFDRKELMEIDPETEAMVRELWE